jgi:hypothetical protein
MEDEVCYIERILIDVKRLSSDNIETDLYMLVYS